MILRLSPCERTAGVFHPATPEVPPGPAVASLPTVVYSNDSPGGEIEKPDSSILTERLVIGNKVNPRSAKRPLPAVSGPRRSRTDGSLSLLRSILQIHECSSLLEIVKILAIYGLKPFGSSMARKRNWLTEFLLRRLGQAKCRVSRWRPQVKGDRLSIWRPARSRESVEKRQPAAGAVPLRTLRSREGFTFDKWSFRR